MRILVTGGSGFVGTHLCRRLLASGHVVVALDNFSTSDRSAVRSLEQSDRFTLVEGDVCLTPTLSGSFDAIAHMACPASPDEYMRLGLETLRVGSHGSEFVLELARLNQCRIVLTSTSEIYGDPQESPQSESYWGNVNPIGPRSVYDESKRFAEAIFTEYRRRYGVNTGIVRIFNTYGPGLRPHDGRVVSNFIAQALAGTSLTVYGDGRQTRSLCYVDDLVDGLVAMLASDDRGPVNLGNPAELSILDLASLVLQLTGSKSRIEHLPASVDDPSRRRPDISRAASTLGWYPKVPLETGLARTIAWQRSLGIAAASTTN